MAGESNRHDRSIATPNDFILATATAYTAGADLVAPPRCRGLLVGTAGVQAVTMAGNKQRGPIPLCIGINPGRFIAIRSDASNTAEDIWFII